MSGSPRQPKVPFEEKPFLWSKASIDAAVLLADDVLTDEQIAAEARVTDRTLRNWKRHPEFHTKIEAHIEALQDRARKTGLARLDKRIAAYTGRHRRMMQLLEARAADMAEEIAGGDTGTMVRQLKRVLHVYEPDPNDEDGEIVQQTEYTAEYAFDAALMRELRELEKQIAQDAGQWSEKREVSGPDGGPIPITTIAVPETDEDGS